MVFVVVVVEGGLLAARRCARRARCRRRAARLEARSLALLSACGARSLPAEIGSEERPTCCPESRLAAAVMPTVSVRPSSPTSIQMIVLRFTESKLTIAW